MAYLITSKAEGRTGGAESLNIPFKDTQLWYLNLPHYTLLKVIPSPKSARSWGLRLNTWASGDI